MKHRSLLSESLYPYDRHNHSTVMDVESKDGEDVEELKEVLDVVSEKIPRLIGEIMEALMNPERAREFGKAVAEFYSELVKRGMPPEGAARLTEKFMENYSIRSLSRDIFGSAGLGERFREAREDEA